MTTRARREPGPDLPSVVAIVLTFEQPERLVVCLESVLGQGTSPRSVLVVDNASSVPAAEVIGAAGLDDSRVEVLRMEENLGPAGGYAAALDRFLGSSHGLAWVLDDDRRPEPDCLGLLLEEHRRLRTPALLFPTDESPDGVVTNYPSWCGVLIPRPIVEAVGVPRPEFFWWMEDTEYLQRRIPRAGFDVIRVPAARVIHDRADEPTKPSWKYYYETRNSVYYRTHVQGGARKGRLRIALLRTLLRILVLEDRRMSKLRMFVRGYRDGRAARLGRTIPVPSRADAVVKAIP